VRRLALGLLLDLDRVPVDEQVEERQAGHLALPARVALVVEVEVRRADRQARHRRHPVAVRVRRGEGEPEPGVVRVREVRAGVREREGAERRRRDAEWEVLLRGAHVGHVHGGAGGDVGRGAGRGGEDSGRDGVDERFEVPHTVLERRGASGQARYGVSADEACDRRHSLGLVRVRPLSRLLERALGVGGEARLARVALVALDPASAGAGAGSERIKIRRAEARSGSALDGRARGPGGSPTSIARPATKGPWVRVADRTEHGAAGVPAKFEPSIFEEARRGRGGGLVRRFTVVDGHDG
jgi:hypothetical protein